jgi:antitoxin VapB
LDIKIFFAKYPDIRRRVRMPLYIKDDATAQLVAELAELRRVSKQDAVKLAVRAELERAENAIPLRERFAALRAAHPLPPRTGEVADKAFFDELSGAHS